MNWNGMFSLDRHFFSTKATTQIHKSNHAEVRTRLHERPGIGRALKIRFYHEYE